MHRKMLALVSTGRGAALKKIAVPAADGECLVRVLRSGICNTDLEIVRGYAGFVGVIGHEFVGVVETGSPRLKGKRVVGEINVGCGRCAVCSTGDERHCPDRTVLGILGRDGAHAEYLVLPERNLLPVPDNVSDEAAVFVEPLAAALGIAEMAEIGPETRVAVIGDGKLGSLCARVLALRSPNLTVIGRHRSKLQLLENAGIGVMLEKDADRALPRFDMVVEASGSPSGLELAADIVRPSGIIVLKSTFAGNARWPGSKIVVNEIKIVGSRCGRFKPALDLLAAGGIDVHTLISDQLPLMEAEAALRMAGQPGVLKVLLAPD
jgi:threonine dehydrogenase-like Zn-dependent dehydrogenase